MGPMGGGLMEPGGRGPMAPAGYGELFRGASPTGPRTVIAGQSGRLA